MKQKSIYFTAVFFLLLLFQFKYAYPQNKQKHTHSTADHSNYQKIEERDLDRWYWQMPNRVMAEIGIKPGQVVADVGCGIGYFSLKLAKKVGDSGLVFASDIDRGALDYLGEKTKKLGLKNIRIIHGQEDDPLLPEKSSDLILIVNTINLVRNPSLLLKNLKTSLKPGGQIVFIQWDAEKMDPELPGWSAENRQQFTQQAMLRTIYDAGYEVVRILDFLPMQNIYICQPRIPD